MNYIKSILAFFSGIYNNERKLLIFIFIISLLFSLIFLFFFKNIGPSEHRIPGTDYIYYYEPVANDILQGRGIRVQESFTIRYPPGYPIILASIFWLSQLTGINKLEAVVMFNVIITALTCCVLFLLIKLILDKKIALISVFLWATYPFNLWFIKNPNTEVPFILLFYSALLAYVLALRKISFNLFLLSGIFLGFASLIRPITLFLSIPLLVLIFFIMKSTPFRKKLLLSIVFLIGYIVVISPWLIYVYSNTGRLLPLSTGGFSNMAGGLTFMVDKSKTNDGNQDGKKMVLPNDVIDLIERSRVANMDGLGKIMYFFWQEAKNHPMTFLKLIGIKIIRAWYATSEMWWEKQILLAQLIYLVPAIAGIIIWFKKIKEKISYLFLLLIIVFYFWAATIAALSILRYMIPVMGLIMIFSAITIDMIIGRLSKSFCYGP
jgi:4-amino-4-deoxy-L-arabinose transferase-like glycosyltransferase